MHLLLIAIHGPPISLAGIDRLAMTIAAQIAPLLAARQAKADALAAERSARDAFIVAQFAVLLARFDELLRAALGIDARMKITANASVLPVLGRSFANLDVITWSVRASFNAQPQTVTFTPQLDFRQPDQFGLLAGALDFPYSPARARGDRLAQAVLDGGIQLRGKSHASLLLQLPDGLRDLSSDDLQAAFAVWWLRS